MSEDKPQCDRQSHAFKPSMPRPCLYDPPESGCYFRTGPCLGGWKRAVNYVLGKEVAMEKEAEQAPPCATHGRNGFHGKEPHCKCCPSWLAICAGFDKEFSRKPKE